MLRTLAERSKNHSEFGVNVGHFLIELYKITPEKFHELLYDWFHRIIIYDLSVAEASYVELADGNYEIVLHVNAKRFNTLKSGEETEIEINEPIEIGLFNEHPNAQTHTNQTIYLKQHQITMDGQEIKIIVSDLPKYVSIDPYGTRIDENLFDNTIKLK